MKVLHKIIDMHNLVKLVTLTGLTHGGEQAIGIWTVSTEALPVLACVLSVDLEVQRRAAMYYSARKTMDANFLTQRDRAKIFRLFIPHADVWEEIFI